MVRAAGSADGQRLCRRQFLFPSVGFHPRLQLCGPACCWTIQPAPVLADTIFSPVPGLSAGPIDIVPHPGTGVARSDPRAILSGSRSDVRDATGMESHAGDFLEHARLDTILRGRVLSDVPFAAEGQVASGNAQAAPDSCTLLAGLIGAAIALYVDSARRSGAVESLLQQLLAARGQADAVAASALVCVWHCAVTFERSAAIVQPYTLPAGDHWTGQCFYCDDAGPKSPFSSDA